jgi:uncharacterized OB-fold protein
MAATGGPLPVVNDPDTAGHFEAAARGVLALCVCSKCATVLHLPRAYCFNCGSHDVEWRAFSGAATLYSWTVVERQLMAAFPAPNTVVVVQLDDAPSVHLIGQLPGRPELRASMPMRVTFDHLADGVVMPNWEVAGA